MFQHIIQTGNLSISLPVAPALKRNTTTKSLAPSAEDVSERSCEIVAPRPRTRHISRERVRDRRVGNDGTVTTSTVTTNSRNRFTQSYENWRHRSSRSSVQFGDVTIREYNRSLGDWWDIQHGLGLGWEYVEQPAMPLPKEEDTSWGALKSKYNTYWKMKNKLNAWILVNRKKRKSTGTIQANKVADPKIRTSDNNNNNNNEGIKKKKRKRKRRRRRKKRKPSDTDEKSMAQMRAKLLMEFGFSDSELKLSEGERKLLHLEYRHWTQSSAEDRQGKKVSGLFAERFLADAWAKVH
mmetsp:Transcript_27749/g.59317  ORF Transcript_27749/g.59317 Transcript_27749/m.59317 type:complete len:295 (+) Transcript_27749:212-1096(+)